MFSAFFGYFWGIAADLWCIFGALFAVFLVHFCDIFAAFLGHC